MNISNNGAVFGLFEPPAAYAVTRIYIMKESTKSNILMYVLGLISIVGAAFGAIQYFKNSDNPQVLLENRVASLERSDTQQGEDIKEMKLHNAQIDRRLDKIDMNLDYLVLNFKSITEMRVKNQRD